MKKFFTMMIMVLTVAVAMAQAPEKFSYQAIVRNASNALVTNASVSVRVSILQGSVTGNLVYMEMHTVPTNANGLLTLEIGGGTVQQGSFADINWANGPFFLKTEIDPAGGSNYNVTSTQQLMSVPYALYAKEADNGFSGDYNDLTNTPQIPQNVSELTNDAGYITMDSVPTIPTNVSAFANDAGYLTDYTETDPQFNAWDKDYNDLINTPEIPTVPNNVSAFVNDAGYITMDSVPTIPTNVSAFANDAGYLTEYTETDPEFTAWDKNYNDLINRPEIPTVPNNVSMFINDAGYITMDSVPAIPANVSAFTNDAEYITIDAIPTAVSVFTNDAGYITTAEVQAAANIPTNVSAFTNDAGYLTGYTESQSLANVTAIGNSAGSRQLKDVSDPTESYDAVNLRTLTMMMDSMRAEFQQVLQQQQEQMLQQQEQLQQQIDSLMNVIDAMSADTTGTTITYVVTVSVEGSTTFCEGNSATLHAMVTPASANCSYQWYKGNVLVSGATNNNLVVTTAGSYKVVVTINGSTTESNAVVVTTNPIPQIQITYMDNICPGSASVDFSMQVTSMQSEAPYTVLQTSDFDADRTNVLNAPNHFLSSSYHKPYSKIMDFECGNTYHLYYTVTDANGCVARDTATFTAYDSEGPILGGWSGSPLYQRLEPKRGPNCTYNSLSKAEFVSAFLGKVVDNCMEYDSAYLYDHADFYWHSTTHFGHTLAYDSLDIFSNFEGNQRIIDVVVWDDCGNVAETSAFWFERPDELPVPVYEVIPNHNTVAPYDGIIRLKGVPRLYTYELFSDALSDAIETQTPAWDVESDTTTVIFDGLEGDIAYTVKITSDYGCETQFVVFVPDETGGGGAVVDGQPCPGMPTVTDYDGNTYNTVQIGNQCWMRDNLRTTHYADGTAISAGGDNTSFTVPYYYDYSTHNLPLEMRGYLYNWPAAMHGVASSSANPSGIQGICPAGWHLPSDAEWTQLTDYVKTQSDYVCGGNTNYIAKAFASETGWNSSTNTCAVGNDPTSNNATGFSAVPAGYCVGSLFSHAGNYASFWSSTQCAGNMNYAYDRHLYNDGWGVSSSDTHKPTGRSVRCLRDSIGGGTSQTQPTVTTGEATEITSTSATLNGVVSNPDNVAVAAQGFEWKVMEGGAYTMVNATGETMSYTLTGLTVGTGYTYRAFVTTAEGTSYGEAVGFTTLTTGGGAVIDEKSCPGTPTVTDHDGNVYATVQIGGQCWMRDNLRTTHYADGTAIPAGGDNTSETEPYYYDYSSHSLPLVVRGCLYNWSAAMHGASSSSANPSGVQGICPMGWHLPSDAEWTQLEDYVGSVSEYQCDGRSNNIAKALASTEGWSSSTTTCAVGNDPTSNNATGFSAVPAGCCYGSLFYSAGNYAYFWSSKESSSINAWYRYLSYYNAYVDEGANNKGYGRSVRCLRDSIGGGTSQTQPTVTTGEATEITSTSATLNGVVSNPDNVAVAAQGFEWKVMEGGAYTMVNATGETMSYTLTGLTVGTGYTYRAFVTTAEGTSYGEAVGFTTLTTGGGAVIDEKSCPGTPTVTDHDGNVYATVQIGGQCWMRDNLRTTTSPSTGTYLIPIADTDYTYTGKQARWYNNDSATYAPMNYGLLYNWNAAVDTFNTTYGETSVNYSSGNAVSVSFTCNRRGICPAGWHLPSDEEWVQLENYVGSQSEYTCGGNSSYIGKALASTEGWNTNTASCAVGNDQTSNNATGFSAVPSGICYGSFSYYAGTSTAFWSSTENSSNNAYYRLLVCDDASVSRSSGNYYGFSVRCLRD